MSLSLHCTTSQPPHKLRLTLALYLDMIDKYPMFREWVEREWKRHLDTNYDVLFELPSGDVRGCVDLFRSDTEHYSIEFLMKYAGKQFTFEERSELFAKASQYQCKRLDNEPISNLKKGLIHELACLPNSSLIRPNIELLLKEIGSAETPSAVEIRKILKPLLLAEIGRSIVSRKNGEWEVRINIQNKEVILVFDFGIFSRGFSYEIVIPGTGKHGIPNRISYEGLLGFTSYDMDLLRTDQLGKQLGKVVENIKVVLNLIERYNNAL